MIGQLVGNYRIIELLGEGGMGAVYLAEHPGIGRKAAVKVLHPAYAAETEFVGRFFNEARAANATRHPGIVEIFDFGTLPSGASYIIMELLEGESLAARMRRTAETDVETAVEIIHQAAGALAAAHAKGIVHRDLKPDNMFLVPDQQTPGRFLVKLLDFGIAKLGQGSLSSGSMRTRTGAVMGTPVYMSPEQCRGTKEVDHRADIYALGIILYELLCGAPPFVSEGFGEMTFLHISAPPPPLRERNPHVPERLERIVLKTLAKDPADRFQTAVELQQALRPAPGRSTALDDQALAPSARAGATRAASTSQAGRTRMLPSGTSSTTTFSDAAGAIDALPAPRRRRWVWPLAILGVAAVAGVVVVPRLLAPGAAPQADPEASPATATGAAQPPVRPAAEAPKVVSVAIDSTPSEARLVRVRDGAVLGKTPFRETWPQAAGTEKLRLERDGYRPESVVVPLDLGLTFTVSLSKLAEPATTAATEPPARGNKLAKHHRLAPTEPPGGAAPQPQPARPASPVPDEPVPL
jgi:hypothetical protein